MKSGILLVDKPEGLTSADITNKLKKRFRFSKIGHGGTLDPFATGLLVVLLGEATKVARFLLSGEKEYEACAHLGIETDTGDKEGKSVLTSTVPAISLAQWNDYASKFVGHIQQTPPAYSAVKLKGRPLYDYARSGEEAKVPPRDITIFSLAVTSVTENELTFKVRCSGGTYIRVLAADLARSAGTHAYLKTLRRTASLPFNLKDAWDLEKILAAEMDDLPILPIGQSLSHLPQVECDEAQTAKIRHGNLSVFEELKRQIIKPGYFVLTKKHDNRYFPIAIANHNPMMIPFCSIERVFDPNLIQT